MNQSLSSGVPDALFREGRSFSHWLDRPVTDEQLHRIYELMKWGPTAANSCPVRMVFLKSPSAKEKLKPCLAPGNVDKCMSAPVVVIIAMDMEFYEHLPKLFPHTDARSWYAGNPDAIFKTAFRNSSLQGGYFILAARSLGLDCGPMSGFDAEMMDRAFFSGGRWKSNFICALGYGNRDKLFPRGPRLDFGEACRIE